MSNHGLFVGVSALALALAAKMARRSLISALRRAMAKRWSSGVALVSPLGCRRKGFPIANGGLVATFLPVMILREPQLGIPKKDAAPSQSRREEAQPRVAVVAVAQA